LERRGKRETIITLIIMVIIAVVIVSWLSGLWSCETGRKELTDEERLTISDYVNSVSVLVQQSNRVSIKFFNTMDRARELSREDLDSELFDIIEESRVILENSKGLNPPEFFEVVQGYLELVFETRNKAYEDFRPALFNAIDDLDVDISTAQITNTFLYMFMSDEIYTYFQDRLKESGEKMGINNLTIIDSVILKDKNLTNAENVMGFISEIIAGPERQERRGVAVIEDSIEFNPQKINQQGDYMILASGSTITIAITIQNQGNVIENDVRVIMEYRTEDNVTEEKESIIESINSYEKKVVVIEGFVAHPGRRCEVEITAVPVPGEAVPTNNTATYRFMMEN